MKKVAILFIIIGLAMTIFTAVSFFTKEKVVDIGKIQITADKPHHLKWSPLIGIAIMVVGGVVYLLSNKKGEAI